MFGRKVTDPTPVFNDWRLDLWFDSNKDTQGYERSLFKIDDDKLWMEPRNLETIGTLNDKLEKERTLSSGTRPQIYGSQEKPFSKSFDDQISSEIDLLLHKYSSVLNDWQDVGRSYQNYPQTLNYSLRGNYKHGESNNIPDLYEDLESESATDSQVEQDTQIHYLNEIPAKVRDLRTQSYHTNPGALFAPFYEFVPEIHGDHAVSGSQPVYNENSSLSPLKTVAQEEFVNSVPEISTDGLDKYCKLVEQQRKDREIRINDLGIQLKHSKTHHNDDDPVVPYISHSASEKQSKTRIVASVPPFHQYKGFSIPGSHSNVYKSDNKNVKLKENFVVKSGGDSQKNKEIKNLSKSKKNVTRILAPNVAKSSNENLSGLVTTWAWHQCQESNFRELGNLKNANSSSHSPPTHDTDYQQSISASAQMEPEVKPPSVAISDIKAVLNSSKKNLSEEARTILNDLQLSKSDNFNEEEGKNTDSKQVFELNTVASEPHFSKISRTKPYKRKINKITTDNPILPLSKNRHYNPEDVRKYIAQQQVERKRRQLAEQEATKFALEQKRKRLQELYRKQKETVLSNKSTNKKPTFSKKAQFSFPLDSNNKQTTSAVQLSSKLLDEPSDQASMGIIDQSDFFSLSQSEADDEDEHLSNDGLSEAEQLGSLSSPNHPFVTLRSSKPRYLNSTPSYTHSPVFNVTSNSYLFHPEGKTTSHSLPQSVDAYNSKDILSPNAASGPYSTPVPYGLYNKYLPISKNRTEKIKAIKEVADVLNGRIAAHTELFTQGINSSLGPQSFPQQNSLLSDNFSQAVFNQVIHKNKNVHAFDSDTVPGITNLNEHVQYLEKKHLHHKAAMKIQSAYRDYQTRHNDRRPNNDYIKKSRSRTTGHNTYTNDSLLPSGLEPFLIAEQLPNDNDLIAYSKKMAQISALNSEKKQTNPDEKSNGIENRNSPLIISEPDKHSVINIFMQRLKEEKSDIATNVNKSLHYISSLQERNNSSSSTEDGHSTSNSVTYMSKTTSSQSPSFSHETNRQNMDISNTYISENNLHGSKIESKLCAQSSPNIKISLNESFSKISSPSSSQKSKLQNKRENDISVNKDISLSYKLSQDNTLRTVSPDNTLNMSSSLIDDEAITEINSSLNEKKSSVHSKIDFPNQSKSAVESTLQEEFNQCSPNTLHVKLAAELARLETVEESLKQLDNIERARAIAVAQQETVSLAHILKARQQNHKQEIENLSIQMKEETYSQLEEIKRLATESVQITTENVKDLNAETPVMIQQSANKLIQAQAETVKAVAEAAKQLSDASLLNSVKSTVSNSNKIAAQAVTAAVSVALDEQRKQQSELLNHLRQTKNISSSSNKTEKRSGIDNEYICSEARSSKSSASSKKKNSSRENSSSSATSFDYSKMDKSQELNPIDRSQSVSEVILEENEKDFSKFEEEFDPSYHSNKDKSYNEATFSEANLMESEKWKQDSDRILSGEDSFKKYTAEMIKQFMDDDEVRSQHHAALLRLRERALKEKTKAEMTWLELQKQQLRDKGADDLMPPLRKKQRGILLRFQQERAEIKRLKEAQKVASQKRQLLFYQQQEIARIQMSTQQILEKIKKSGIFYAHPSNVPTEDEVSMPIYDGAQSDIQEEAEIIIPTDNSVTENPSETPSISQDTSHLSPSDSESNVLKKLKKLENQSSARYLTKREQKLRQRREHVEALLAWGENLDKEEAEISKMEKKAMELLGRREKAIQAPDSGNLNDKNVLESNNTKTEDASYLTSKEMSFIKSEIQEELPYEKNRKSTSSESSISEEIQKQILSFSKEIIDSRQEIKDSANPLHSDASNTSNSILLEQLSEDSPRSSQKSESSSALLKSSEKNSVIHSKSESIKEVISSPLVSKSKSNPVSGEIMSSSKKSLTLHSKNILSENIPVTKISNSNFCDPTISLKPPLSPRPTQKSRDLSGSEESVSVSHSETASDQSDMEGRIRALKEELKRRKVEAARLKREQKRRNHERLRAQEASLLIQIEAYDKFITQAKEDLNKELELDLKAPGLKPQIKQPRRLQRQDSIESPTVKSFHSLHSEDVIDNDDVFKPTSPGWMADQLSLLKRVSLESIDESLESSISPETLTKSNHKTGSEINSETDEDIKEVATFFSVDHSDGSESVKSDSTIRNQSNSPSHSIDIEEHSVNLDKHSPATKKEVITLEKEIDSSENLSSKVETIHEFIVPEGINHQTESYSLIEEVFHTFTPSEHKSALQPETVYSEDVFEDSADLESHSKSDIEIFIKSLSINEFHSIKNNESAELNIANSQHLVDHVSHDSFKSSSSLEDIIKPQIGTRVSVKNSKMGILKFVGNTLFAEGVWAGVALDQPLGTCDGTIDGVEYFHCDFNYGIFVPLNDLSLPSILEESKQVRSELLVIEDSPSKDSEDTLVEEKYEVEDIKTENSKRSESIVEQMSNAIEDETVHQANSFEKKKIEMEVVPENTEKEINLIPFTHDLDLQEVIASTAFAVEQFSDGTLPWLISEEKIIISEKDKKEEIHLNRLVDKITNSLTDMIMQDSFSVIGTIAKHHSKIKKPENCISLDTGITKNDIYDPETTYEIHIEEEMIIEISDKDDLKLSQESLVADMTQTLAKNLLNDAITCMMSIGKEKLISLKMNEVARTNKEVNSSETTLDKVHNLLARHNEKKKEQNFSKTSDIFALSPQDAYADALESPEFPSPVHVPSTNLPASEIDEIVKERQGGDSRDGSTSPTSPVPRPSSPIFGEPAALNQSELQEKLAALHFLDMDIMEGSVFGEHSLFGDQEWFDDDFGLGHQKEAHRQIPQKPAPPYIPPAVQWNLSRLELKKITAKAFCAVAHNENDVQELVNKAVKEFYNRRKYGEPLVDVPPPINYFTREDRNEDIESRSRRTYKRFIFELTGYLVQEVYRDDEAPEKPPWMKPSRNYHHKFCKKYPANEQELQEVILNSINHLLGFTIKPRQEWPYVKWNRKKKDRVDEILVQELREEEQSWVIYDDEELSVKMQLTDGILDSLLMDTVRTFSAILEKKKS